MSSKTVRLYFEDILQSANYIEQFLSCRTLEALETDRMLRSAVER
jgi:uncharacterized protein with HEPN domain